MGTEGLTKWKTDIDFFWVAALVYRVRVYVWSLEQGTKVFTPSGDRPWILNADEMRHKTMSSTDGWAGEVVLAYNNSHYYTMMTEL